MLNRTPTFIVPIQRELQDRRFYRTEIWMPARREHVYLGGRRKWLQALTLIFDYEGHIFHRDDRPYDLPDIDPVFEPKKTSRRKEELENDMRWMSGFLRAASCGQTPKSYSPKYQRLELIYLYCKIRQYEELRLCKAD